MVAAVSPSSTGLWIRGSGAQRGVWRWHSPAQPVAVMQGLLSQGHSVPLVQGVHQEREPSPRVPGLAQPLPCVPAMLGTLSSTGLCHGSLGAGLKCLLSLLPAGGDAMAAASSIRARAGPPCEKSPLSVKGGCCCLAGTALPAVCVLCLHPGLAHSALRGSRGWSWPCVPWAGPVPWGRGCGALPGRAGAPVAARWLPAPGAASPQSRVPLCPSAATAGLGLPPPVLPRCPGAGRCPWGQ